MLKSFPQSVKEALKFYVYALVDPRDGKIFYIGKGINDRVFNHVQDAVESDDSTLKLETIRAVRRDDKNVEYYILRHNLNEAEAFLVESALIDLMTYDKFNVKNLLTNIVAGHHQWDEGIKTMGEIIELYNCEPLKLNSGEMLLLVSLNKSYNTERATGGYIRPSIYDATRMYWKLSARRIKDIKYVLGVYAGIVRCVIKPERWTQVEERWACEGEVIENSPYLNKSTKDYPFGRGGAIRYVNG